MSFHPSTFKYASLRKVGNFSQNLCAMITPNNMKSNTFLPWVASSDERQLLIFVASLIYCPDGWKPLSPEEATSPGSQLWYLAPHPPRGSVIQLQLQSEQNPRHHFRKNVTICNLCQVNEITSSKPISFKRTL